MTLQPRTYKFRYAEVKTAAELCTKYNIKFPTMQPRKALQGIDLEDVSLLRNAFIPGGVSRFAEQSGVGHSGTRYSGGVFSGGSNTRYAPYRVRGCYGSPGLYYEYYEGEPLIYKAVEEHKDRLVSGTWELQAPKHVPERLLGRMEEFVAFHDAALRNLASEWDTFVENASMMLVYGFAPFNIIWGGIGQGERLYIHDLCYYEPSTVDRHVFSEDMTTHVATIFQTGGDKSSRFAVPAWGKALQDQRLMFCNVAAHGMNIEGVSPLRPSLHYKAHKQLLMQIAAVTAEKYGVPQTVIYEDPAWAEKLMVEERTEADEDEREDVFEAQKFRSGLDADVHTLPPPLRMEILALPGEMPTFGDMIAYCDQMELSPLHIEGSLVGLQRAVGSYALGQVKERQGISAAPSYARRIAKPINKLIKRLAQREFGPRTLTDYPKLVWRIHGLQDVSKWLSDVVMFTQAAPSMPEKIRTACLERLDLPMDAYEDMDDEDQTKDEEE